MKASWETLPGTRVRRSHGTALHHPRLAVCRSIEHAGKWDGFIDSRRVFFGLSSAEAAMAALDALVEPKAAA